DERRVTGQRPTILLTAARGQLGRELAFALRGVGDVVACDRATLDLGDADRIVDVVRRSRPHVIVNAGAYTAVDRAERERDRAFVVNADAPRVLAEEAKRANAILVHYSSDDALRRERAAASAQRVWREQARRRTGDRGVRRIIDRAAHELGLRPRGTEFPRDDAKISRFTKRDQCCRRP